MPARYLYRLLLSATLLVVLSARVSAQVVETVGSRALGMGGAFVAVANDSSATWWNPGALAAGPFLDISLARAVTETTGELPANRDKAGWFALATPPFGFSYYRLRITDIRELTSTVTESGNREEGRAGLVSLPVSQLGFTLVHTLIEGVHAGATFKYVRGTARSGVDDATLDASDLLDRGDDLEGGDADNEFDMDIGVMAVAGSLRLGVVVRNVLEPDFNGDGFVAQLDRQVRIGAAYDGAAVGRAPLILALDADVLTTTDVTGDRRNVAVGAERWFAEGRVGVRGGARINTVGTNAWAATGGASVAVRSGLFVDGHVVRGGTEDDRGWGIGIRVSF